MIPSKEENALTGTLGALLGALLGGMCLVMLRGQGLIAALSGLLTAVCALKGYEFLGGRLTKRGIYLCIGLMVVVPAAAYLLSQLLFLKENFPYLTFGEVARTYFYALKAVPGALTETLFNLLILYALTAVGAVTTLLSHRRKSK